MRERGRVTVMQRGREFKAEVGIEGDSWMQREGQSWMQRGRVRESQVDVRWEREFIKKTVCMCVFLDFTDCRLWV